MSDTVEWLDAADREEWLQHRRRYITATDVARLEESARAWADIAAEKRGDARPVPVNAYMQWGIDREKVLVAYAGRRSGLDVRCNDRVAVRGRYAATPDGVGDDVTIECKTGSPSGLRRDRRKHEAQMQWQMHVLGVSRCLYVTEERLQDEFGVFVPGRARVETIARDEERIASLVDLAERFLAGADTDWELDVLVADVLSAREDANKAARRREEAENALREYIGDRDYKGATVSGTVSLTLPRRTTVDVEALSAQHADVVAGFTRTEIDVKALREAHPELVAKYEQPVEGGKRRLTVTEVKS